MEWNGMLMKCNEILNIKCKYELLYARIVRINKNKVYNWMWCYHRMLLKG